MVPPEALSSELIMRKGLSLEHKVQKSVCSIEFQSKRHQKMSFSHYSELKASLTSRGKKKESELKRKIGSSLKQYK